MWPRAALGAFLLFSAAGCHLVAELGELEARESRPAPTFEVVWVKHFAATGGQRVEAVAIDGGDNVVLAGKLHGTVDFGGGPVGSAIPADVFVLKLGPDGSHRWQRLFGESVGVEISDVAAHVSGEVAFVGWLLHGSLQIGDDLIESGGRLVGYTGLLSPAGEPVTSVLFGSTTGECKPRAVAFGPPDHLIVAGAFLHDFTVVIDGTVRDSHTALDRRDLFAAQIELPGRQLAWSRAFPGMHDQELGDMDFRDDSMLLAATSYGVTTVGDLDVEGPGDADVLIAKLPVRFDRDSGLWGAGDPYWAASFGDEDKNCHDWCELSVALDPEGRTITTGAFTGLFNLGGSDLPGAAGADVFVSSFEPFGLEGQPKHAWSRSFGDVFEQRPHDLAIVDGSHVVVAGLFNGDIDFGGGLLGPDDDYQRDVFLASFDAQGGHRWSTPIRLRSPTTDPEPDRPGRPRIATDSRGDLILALSFRGELDLFGHVLRSADGDDDYDIVVAKLRVP